MTWTHGYILFMVVVFSALFIGWLVVALRDHRIAREQLDRYRVEPDEPWAREIAYAALFQRQHINLAFTSLLKKHHGCYWAAIILDEERLVRLVNMGVDYDKAYYWLYRKSPPDGVDVPLSWA